jgi:HPt (histidine-containing phosphotransfer) domain-containing protein
VAEPAPASDAEASAAAPLADAARETAPIDAEALLKRCLNKQTLVNKVLDKFSTQAEVQFDQIAGSLARTDAEATARAAHSLKGSAAYLAAEPLRAVAARIEELARENQLDAVQEQLDELRSQLNRCMELIPELLASGNAEGQLSGAAR